MRAARVRYPSLVLFTQSHGMEVAAITVEANEMEAITAMTKTPCSGPLPELEIPMINTMVACLGNQHRELSDLAAQLAFAATRLARDPSDSDANNHAAELWDEIRHDLWSHLQIEDELVFAWGEVHHALRSGLRETLEVDRDEMRRLLAALPNPDAGDKAQTADRETLAAALLTLARALDSHAERYDGEVLPSILRALYRK
jgi:hypothetical protein